MSYNHLYDVIIIGGGIAGLSSAIKLSSSGRDVLIIESQNELGGKIKSVELMGYITEEGPDELISGYRKFDELLALTGAMNNLISPSTSKFLIYSRNKFRRFPEALLSGVPSLNLRDVYSFATSGLLSINGYLRALLEPLIKVHGLDEDISIKLLFEKKFGSEFTTSIIDPLFGGIMGADISIISSRSYIPYIYNLVRAEKSLSLSFRKSYHQNFGIKSTQRGLNGIVEFFKKFAETNGVKKMTGLTVNAVNYRSDEWQIETGSSYFKSKKLILAVPAYAAAKLVSDERLSSLLSSIKYSDIAVVNSIYKSDDVVLSDNYSGFLMPSNSGYMLRGCSFMSRKWSYAKMNNYEIIRSFIKTCKNDSEDHYIQKASEELIKLGIVKGNPIKSVVKIWNSAMPIYSVGHHELIGKINELISPGMYLAGAPYNGVGVASSGISGIEAAEKIISERPD